MQTRFTVFTVRCLLAALMFGVLLSAGQVVGQPLEEVAGTSTAATPADGTVAPPAPEVEVPSVLGDLLTIWLPRLVLLCTALTAIFPSTNKVMRVIDAFAGAWGKARPDPKAQQWGKAIKL